MTDVGDVAPQFRVEGSPRDLSAHAIAREEFLKLLHADASVQEVFCSFDELHHEALALAALADRMAISASFTGRFEMFQADDVRLPEMPLAELDEVADEYMRRLSPFLARWTNSAAAMLIPMQKPPRTEPMGPLKSPRLTDIRRRVRP